MAARARDATRPAPWVGPIGFVAGFLDASGGGGWGPLATSSLVGSGHAPRMAVGSVNTTEFFVTVAAATTFFVELGASPWKELLALIAGGMLAAPLGGWMVKHVPPRAADDRGRLPGDRTVALADRAGGEVGVSYEVGFSSFTAAPFASDIRAAWRPSPPYLPKLNTANHVIKDNRPPTNLSRKCSGCATPAGVAAMA